MAKQSALIFVVLVYVGLLNEVNMNTKKSEDIFILYQIIYYICWECRDVCMSVCHIFVKHGYITYCRALKLYSVFFLAEF